MASGNYNFLSDDDYDYVPDKYVFKNERDTTYSKNFWCSSS
jgi:hypothetical protein